MLFQPYKRHSTHGSHVLLPLQGCGVSGKHWERRIGHCCLMDTAKKGWCECFSTASHMWKTDPGLESSKETAETKKMASGEGQSKLLVKYMCINTWAHLCSGLVSYDFFSVSSSSLGALLQSHSGVRGQCAQLWGGKITPSSFWSSVQTWEGVKNSLLSPAIVHNCHLPHTMSTNNGKGKWTNPFLLLYKNLIPCDIEFLPSISKWLAFNDNKFSYTI